MKRLGFVLLVPAAVAVAGPPQLVLTHSPSPRSLKMRRAIAQAPASAPLPRPRMPMPAAPSVSATSPEPIEDLEGLRDVKKPVSFSLTLGYQVDGARPSEQPNLGGRQVVAGTDYAKLRSYGFGEGFLSTRGVGVASLETYFALRFQAARTIQTELDPNDPELKIDVTSPIATWFDRSGAEVRSGWAEVKDFLPKRFGLQNFRIRAGSQFVYGPWILHLDGINFAYEGPTLTASLYSGARHTDYTRSQTTSRPAAGGASIRIDLRGLTNAVPIAIQGEYLGLSRSEETGQNSVHTELIQADWRPGRDIAVIASMRGVDGAMANQRIELRTRYKQVTNFVFDISRRFSADWRWDPALSRPSSTTLGEVLRDADSLDARRYLDLGPIVPQLIASARAGTLIRENIDLLARVAIASDLLRTDQQSGSYSAPYVELGGGVEIKLRRQVAVGFSALSRQTNRDIVASGDRLIDTHGGAPDHPVPDPAQNQLGEQGFTELGATLKMTLGARKFSAMVEGYGRNTRYSVLYSDLDPMTPVPATDVRGGGRFTVDAWIGRRIRVFASYDVSSQISTSPEISGYKSLRLSLTGTY